MRRIFGERLLIMLEVVKISKIIGPLLSKYMVYSGFYLKLANIPKYSTLSNSNHIQTNTKILGKQYKKFKLFKEFTKSRISFIKSRVSKYAIKIFVNW